MTIDIEAPGLNTAQLKAALRALTNEIYVQTAKTGNYTIDPVTDNGQMLVYNNAANSIFTLPSNAAVGSNFSLIALDDGMPLLVPAVGAALASGNGVGHNAPSAPLAVISAFVRSNSGGNAAQWVITGSTAALTVPVAGTTWDSAHKNAGITLSNSDLTATGASGSWKSVLGTTPQTLGAVSLYMEYTLVSGWDETMLGFGTIAANLSNFTGNNSESFGIWYGGSTVMPSGSFSLVTNPSNGSVIGVWIDDTDLKFRVDAASFETVDATSFIGAGGPFFPMVSMKNAQIIANFGATAFAHTIPGGATSWDAAA